MEQEKKYATKLDRIMSERKLTVYALNKRLKAKRLPLIDATAFGKMRAGKKGLGANLNSKPTYPSVLERICIALGVRSSDLLEY